MSDVTEILARIEQGDPRAGEQLLPLVYDELRRLAAAKLAGEKPGQTLQATALVHEAYLRLVGDGAGPDWNGRGHFFGAAAEAMRRILVERARRRGRSKHGGGRDREQISLSQICAPSDCVDLVDLDEALDRLVAEDSQAAEVLGVSPRKADFVWSFARAWLRRELSDD
jgi:RNA polymerase sigma factor (TIGR02999 family)